MFTWILSLLFSKKKTWASPQDVISFAELTYFTSNSKYTGVFSWYNNMHTHGLIII